MIVKLLSKLGSFMHFTCEIGSMMQRIKVSFYYGFHTINWFKWNWVDHRFTLKKQDEICKL